MTQTLDSVCELIVDCEHKTAPTVADGPFPLIRTPDIGLGRLLLDKAQRVTETTYEAWTKRATPRTGDLILAREAPVGNVGIVPPGVRPVLGQRTVLIRPTSTLVNPGYLNYLLSGPSLRSWMEGASSGATVPHLNMADIRSMELPSLPSLRDQGKVAALLGAYDDLIDNNNRRIKILEETAQRIYREWFVNLRYPGHEGVPLVDSELGPIPLGWVVRRLGDVATFDKGLSYKGAFLTEQGLPMANLKCILVGGGFRRDGTKSYSGDFKPRHSVAAGDLIMANTDLTQVGGVIGSPAIIPRRGFENGGLISHHLFAIRPRISGLTTAVLFHMLADERFRQFARGRASGTTVLGLRTADCEDYRLAVPTTDVLVRFGDIIDDVLSLSETLRESTESATAIRDLLLPRLTSGEVDVEGLNIEVPGVAAA